MNIKSKLELKALEVANSSKIIDERLYPSQQEAINKLADWFKSSSLECTLEGYAGTGKTFILQYFINHVVDKTFTVTAPTHKALRVLEATVGRKGKTLHSLHGLKPNTDLANFDIERPQFATDGKDPSIQHYHLVIIDECSMINKDLFLLNQRRSKQYNVKILYVGDSLQLPPVNEVLSPTFAAVKQKVILTQIVRQEEGNPLLELFGLIRNDIVEGKDGFLRHIAKNRKNIKGNVGYEIKPTIEFKDYILSEFKSDNFIKNIDHLRLTSYTNPCVSSWNSIIRDHFIGSDEDIIHIDDLLVSYNTIVDDFKDPIIMNSEDYIIEDMRTYVSDESLKTFAVNLKSMYDGRITSPFLIVDWKDDSFKKYVNILNLLHESAIADPRKWYVYYKFKNRFLTTRSFKLPKSKKIVKKDIDYGYSLTTHKLQGSTFENIAIDLTDIVFFTDRWGRRHTYDAITRNKLIYVALSRARNKAILKY